MYRIAIIDRNPNEREQTHDLAAAFFKERGESAAFVICADDVELPPYYDCHLHGDGDQVRLEWGGSSPPWARVKKPLKAEEFFAVLTRWLSLRAPKTIGAPRL